MRAGAALALACVLALGAGCGPASIDELRTQARAAVDDGRFDEARALCEQALARDDVRASAEAHWSFERMRLSSLASTGRCTEVVAALQSAAGADAAHVDADLYARFARDAAAVKDIEGVVALVDAGAKRFPDKHAAFAAVVKQLKKSAKAGDPRMEALAQISYLSGQDDGPDEEPEPALEEASKGSSGGN